MSINEDILREVTQTAWQAMLGISLEASGAPAKVVREDHIVSQVSIHGAWDGTVFIRWTPTAAHNAARLLYQSDTPSAEEVRDLIGEMANIVGGNLKGLLPGPSWLSLPIVEHSPGTDIANAVAVHEAWFECAGEPVGVRVVETAPPGRLRDCPLENTS
jgi:hypothetical protein